VREIKCSSWVDFEQKLKKLRQDMREKYGNQSSSLLFRGQSNSTWQLETTLERHGQKRMSYRDFYQLISRIGPAIEAFTSAKVNIPTYDRDLMMTFGDLEQFFEPDRFPTGPLLSYIVYLRHHGFPSPLLDWSFSPYVAVFFAFKEISYGQPANPPERSIFVYCETPEGVKGGAVGEPTIRSLGPYLREAHPRHFRQQSTYTVCSGFEGQWHFDSHQHVFECARPGQDFLWKLDIPSTEQVEVLRTLNDYNLNAFSLFGSEETLLETMWLREQVLRERNA